MIACITSKRLCLLEEVEKPLSFEWHELWGEQIISQFECSEEQWGELTNPENSWSMSNSTIYLNQEPFITL